MHKELLHEDTSTPTPHSGWASDHCAFLTVTAVYVVAVALVFLWLFEHIHSGFAYVLDDPYISLAVAKNFAQHGVWGPTQYAWANVMSSPLYGLLLSALVWLFGQHESIPLIVNMAASVALLWVVSGILRRRAPWVPRWIEMGFLLIFMVILPMPALTFTGMEHILHTLVCVLLLDRFTSVLDTQHCRKKQLQFCAIALVAIGIRYESGFLLLPMVIALALRRRWSLAAGTALATVTPVIILGVYSLRHRGMFLPNPIVMKGSLAFAGNGLLPFEALKSLLCAVAEKAHKAAALLGIVALVVFYLLRNGESRRQSSWVAAAVVVTAVYAHLCCAGIGWFYRYEAYLYGLCLVALIPAFTPIMRAVSTDPKFRVADALISITIACVLFSLPLQERGSSLLRIPRAMTNIYQQQRQMALFLRDYYMGSAVAANDIGFINYLADMRCVDILGLGDNWIARQKASGQFGGASSIGDVCKRRGAPIAVIYAAHFDVPEQWIRVCDWTIPFNTACWDDTVSFYATNVDYADGLRRRLREFAPRLPKGVKVHFLTAFPRNSDRECRQPTNAPAPLAAGHATPTAGPGPTRSPSPQSQSAAFLPARYRLRTSSCRRGSGRRE